MQCAINANRRQSWSTTSRPSVPGGWPLTTYISVTTHKGSGLADAITQALNSQIANGTYGKVLERWNLKSEAIAKSETNSPGLAAH
jgi:polar amino acid transport system substrate-binding protein